MSKKDVDLVGIIDLSVFYNEMICLNHHNILFFSTHLFTGRLALKLVENKLSLVHKSAVFAHVHHLILWASSDPLQSTIEAHEIGKKVGQQQGDFLNSGLNWVLSIITGYLAGACLDKVKANSEDFIVTMQS